MARRNRGSGSNLLRRYGYPTDPQLRREAAKFAGAAVPTVRSIHRQYDKAQNDNTGFSEALLAALGESADSIGAGYDTAQQQQGALDTATQARLSELDPAYAPGAGLAAGARSDSATAALIASGAAERAAAGKQPGIGASMAYLGHQSLLSGEQDAIKARQDAFRSAYAQMLQQVQANALSRASFVAGRQDASFSRQMQQAQLGLQQQSLLDSESQQRWARRIDSAQLMAQYGFDIHTGQFVQTDQSSNTAQALAHKYGLTPNEVINLQKHTSDQVEALLAQGYKWKDAMHRAEANGVPPEIARFAVMSIYSNPPHPPAAPDPNGFKLGANDGAYKTAKAQYDSQMKAYTAAIKDWQSYVASSSWKAFIKSLQRGVAQPTPVKGPQRGVAGWTGTAAPSTGGGGGVPPDVRDPFFYSGR